VRLDLPGGQKGREEIAGGVLGPASATSWPASRPPATWGSGPTRRSSPWPPTLPDPRGGPALGGGSLGDRRPGRPGRPAPGRGRRLRGGARPSGALRVGGPPRPGPRRRRCRVAAGAEPATLRRRPRRRQTERRRGAGARNVARCGERRRTWEGPPSNQFHKGHSHHPSGP
jgi:hypothetical protein